jgi:hypothetical protein
LNKAIDDVRAAEAQELARTGYESRRAGTGAF